jgi:hypothetical protein
MIELGLDFRLKWAKREVERLQAENEILKRQVMELEGIRFSSYCRDCGSHRSQMHCVHCGKPFGKVVEASHD